MPRQLTDALSPIAVRTLGPGRYADGNGLYLAVTNSLARIWVWRGVVQGRRRELGMGSARYVSLKEARETARVWKKIAHDGGDPAAVRDRQRRGSLTFAEAARRYWQDVVDGKMRSERSAATWLNPLVAYAWPAIGRKRLSQISTADIAAVLAPIWTSKPETGRKIYQRLRVVFDWGRVTGHLEGVNPVEGVMLALPKQTDRKQHFAALPWKEMPALWPRLEAAEGMGALALRFAILTAARTGEVRGASWSEVDLQTATWTVPGHRMKAEREHRVPLSSAALAILKAVEPLAGTRDDLLFPSMKPAGRSAT